ncbi:hypothetical protein GW17_00026389 [Ensete ventricosum]|nr:hypothetical protein GW17_00026389 [Ensete ventricosum]RZR91766.1 hypothetical protein BHM03_00019951 [Ensete ventricosum]
MTTSYKFPLRVDMEIKLNGGLTWEMVGVRTTINSMEIEEWSNLSVQLTKAKLGLEGLNTGQEDAEAGALEEYATVLPFELS